MAEQKKAEKKAATNQDDTAPLQAGVDPETVSDEAPNGRTDGAAGSPQYGRGDLPFPTGVAVDYDEVTEGEKADAERLHNAAVSPEADGVHVVGAGDTLKDSLFDGSGDFVTLTKDVVEEFYFPDTNRPSYKLLFAKGQVVRRADIEALNTRLEATRAVAGGDVVEAEDEAPAEAEADEKPAKSRAKSK